MQGSWLADVQTGSSNTSSICGLEISFSSVPQDIDIKVIPSNNEEPGEWFGFGVWILISGFQGELHPGRGQEGRRVISSRARHWTIPIINHTTTIIINQT